MPCPSLSRVIRNEACIGCGACAFVAPQRFAVALDAAGHYRAREIGAAGVAGAAAEPATTAATAKPPETAGPPPPASPASTARAASAASTAVGAPPASTAAGAPPASTASAANAAAGAPPARDPAGTASEDRLARLCPMSGAGRDETAIAADLFPDLPVSAALGRHRSCLAGHVAEGAFRAEGGSGGLVSWLAAELLERGAVDAVLHVLPLPLPLAGPGTAPAPAAPDATRPPPAEGAAREAPPLGTEPPGRAAPPAPLFGYGFSREAAAIRAGAKSRYHPVTLAGALERLAQGPERVLVIALPCFVKALRLLEEAGALPPGRMAHSIGLVCGHLKSRHYADYLAWQAGCPPGQLATIDFRHKLPHGPASAYAMAHTRHGGGAPRVTAMAALRGGDWGEGQFRNPACGLCDDVLAECADIAVGDAWLPGHVEDPRGANLVVTRSAALEALLREAMAAGRLALTDIPPEAAARSQAAGLRDRREGLAHRLARRAARGQWRPRKRVAPRLAPNLPRRLLYDLRAAIARRSAASFAAVRAEGGGLAVYHRRMAPLLLPHALLRRLGGWRGRLRALRRGPRRGGPALSGRERPPC